MKRRFRAVRWFAAALACPSVVAASDLPPWRDTEDMPISDAASVIVQRLDQPVFGAPSAAASRRGTARLGARLPWYGAKRGSGCAARWLNVGPYAWICQDAVAFDEGEPLGPSEGSAAANGSGLPFQYYFVGAGGSNGYRRLEDAEDVAPDRELEPGFAIAVVEEGVKGGARYVRTHHGLWVPLRDLAPVAPFEFHGEVIAAGKVDWVWVVEDRAAVFVAPGGAASKSEAPRHRFDKVDVLEEKTGKTGGYFRVGDKAWLKARDVRRAVPGAVPAGLRSGERWIDVDLASQTLIAYEGETPVFATLVSTGKGKEGADDATPKGEFRIWVKLASSNMDNLEDEDAARYYAIEDVPYVQYFAKGVGLHGAFWHRGFGHERSHGCVNLAPLDAQRLFAFTSPHLPAGWTAVLPTSVEGGTLVRVR